MIDFTTIQANPIPPPITELQIANKALQGKNNTLRNILIVGGIIAAIYVGYQIIKLNQENNERENKGKYPNIKKGDRI